MRIVIIGAGPAGLLLAHYLAARSPHYQISIYEKRSDPRLIDPDLIKTGQDRTFAISLTERGQQALQAIDGLWPTVEKRGMAMYQVGFYSHKKKDYQLFKRNLAPGKFHLLINRNDLCSALLDSLDGDNPKKSVQTNFNAPCLGVDLNGRRIYVEIDGENQGQDYDLLVGADGVRSVLRQAMLTRPGFDFEQSYFKIAWKVFHLPRPEKFASNTSYFFKEDAPGKAVGSRPNETTGAAIPELNDNVCLLMFWPHDWTEDGIGGDRGKSPDESLQERPINPPGINTAEDFQKRINERWLPGLQMTLEQARQIFAQRPSPVVQAKCNRYHDLPGQAVLLGDAAHSMSSLLAQGCQAAFGDAIALDGLLQEEADNLQAVLPKYSAMQIPEGHAITELNTNLRAKRRWLGNLYSFAMLVQGKLNKAFPQWFSPTPSTLISRTAIPYSQIAKKYKFWMRLIERSNKMN